MPTTEAPHMTEAELQSVVIELAQLKGWLVHHDRPARTAKGWRTPIQGTPGFPDLVLARNGRVIFAELKSERGAMRGDQLRWMRELAVEDVRGADVELEVWRPEDWRNGTIEEALA